MEIGLQLNWSGEEPGMLEVNSPGLFRSTIIKNAAWCKRQHVHLPVILRGKNKMVVSSSNLEAAHNCGLV